MSSISRKYNMGRYVEDRYEFQHGRDGDIKVINFIDDDQQRFKVPAKSLFIQNHGGGAGDNYIYFRTIHNTLGTSKVFTLEPDAFINYTLGECLFYGLVVWCSNANCMFSMDATSGEWTDKEIDAFQSSPIFQRVREIMSDQSLTTGLVF